MALHLRVIEAVVPSDFIFPLRGAKQRCGVAENKNPTHFTHICLSELELTRLEIMLSE